MRACVDKDAIVCVRKGGKTVSNQHSVVAHARRQLFYEVDWGKIGVAQYLHCREDGCNMTLESVIERALFA